MHCQHMRAICALLIISATAATSFAAPLNLTKIFPDIFSATATIKYTASNSTLTVTGNPQSFDLVSGAPIDHPAIGTPKALSLTMTIDQGTGLPTGGSVSITGNIPALGANSGVLLTGTIGTTANYFGYPAANNDIFEFRFDITGGDLANYYGNPGTGRQAGMIVDGNFTGGIGAVAFDGDFNSDFRNASGTSLNGVADTFVPEPASFAVVSISVLTLLAGSRARRTAR